MIGNLKTAWSRTHIERKIKSIRLGRNRDKYESQKYNNVTVTTHQEVNYERFNARTSQSILLCGSSPCTPLSFHGYSTACIRVMYQVQSVNLHELSLSRSHIRNKSSLTLIKLTMSFSRDVPQDKEFAIQRSKPIKY